MSWHNGIGNMRIMMSAGFLRLKFRLYSCAPLYVLAVFCIYLVYSVYVLIVSGHAQMLTVISGILYITTQSSIYYLLYTPAMVVLLSGLIDLGMFEIMIFSRTNTRKSYEMNKLLAILFFTIICVVSMVVVTFIVYLCVENPDIQWQQHCLFMNQTGMQIVNTNLLGVSGCVLIAAQAVLLIVSFLALRLLMLLMKNIFTPKFISVIIPLCISLLVYLLSTCDLPDWLMNILPNSHLFLPHFSSTNHFLTAGIYWLAILLVLLLGVTLSAKYKDIMYEDYEKQMY